MKVTNVSLSILITVKLEDLDSHSAAAAAAVVGMEMAKQVASYEKENHLGYYPAMEYFQEDARGIDADLLDAADNIAWLATKLVWEEVRKHLRPIFNSLRFDAMQNLLYTMPRVRPGKPSAQKKLAEHFTPNKVRLEMTAQIVNRDGVEKDLKRYTSHLVHRWLKEHFESIEVTSCRQQN
ncbi:MAG TPA: hypothetical protein ENI67_00125 [Gammaproteobacteria bacterium]|nr:hypothetical protein [Gammaproteobacteria bacterium]